MKTRLLAIIGIFAVISISLSYYAIYDSSTTVFIACDPRYGQIDGQCVLPKPEQYCKGWCDQQELSDLGCNQLILDYVYRATNLFDEEFDGIYYRDLIALPDGVSEEIFEECADTILEKRNMHRTAENMLSSKYTGMSDVGKLLIEHEIDYLQDQLVVTKGPTFAGDPGCGAVIDVNSETHWFKIDSVSNPKNMTLYSENPRPCKINHSSCFCNAQMELTAVTIDRLSYFTPEQEQQVGKRVQKYLETMPHQIPLTKFVVGKYNFNIGDKYTEICGAIITESKTNKEITGEIPIYKYFSGYMEGPNLWDFSLSVDSEKLCAISKNPAIFEYERKE